MPAPANEIIQPGDVLGDKYEIRRKLGEGAWGVVYLAYDRWLREAVALKTFRSKFLSSRAKREAFKKEALLWTRLEKHPFVLTVKLVHEFSSRVYVATDYVVSDHCGRVSLADHLEQATGPMDTETVLRWAIQFCHGMEHINAHGIECHRDIKPANILITLDGILRIADFGLAAAAETLWDASESIVAVGKDGTVGYTLMRIGTRRWCGTPGYTAPEVCRGQGADIRSDVYSFGAVLWQMATGERRSPFHVEVPYRGDLEQFGQEYQQQVYKKQTSGPAPSVNGPLSGVISRCLEADASQRYEDFSDLRGDLDTRYRKLTGVVVRIPFEVPHDSRVRARSLNEKGASLCDLGHCEEAREHFARALAVDHRYASAWYNWGRCLQKTSSYSEATEHYDKAIEAEPDHAHAWASKGGCLIIMGSYQEGIDCCDRALRIDRRLGYAYRSKGAGLESLGRYEEALSCYEQAVSINRRDADNWYARALVEDQLDKTQEAASSYRSFIECAPPQYVGKIGHARGRLRDLTGQ